MENTKETQETASTQLKPIPQVEAPHVHGPQCNHHHALTPAIRSSPKVGRNDPCPCGSNKKFKKCCGSK